MWIANSDSSQARKWIQNIDEAVNYYEKRDCERIVSKNMRALISETHIKRVYNL